MQFNDQLDDIARATGFLSRLPMPARHFSGHDGSLSRAAGMFPISGLLIALCPGLVVLLGSWFGANAAMTAWLALIVLIGITGALHEDGLADSADAFGARGGRDQMLAIMKDSHIGAYGVLAIVTSFSLRAAALTIILSANGGWNTLLILLAVAAVSRAAMVWHWDQLPPARRDGVAASAGAPDSDAARFALISGGLAFAVLAALSAGVAAAIVGIAVVVLAAWQWTSMVRDRLHGHTGDTIGATQQITETACLATLALFL